MLQQQTKLTISDNSGVKSVKCIKILKNFTKKGNFYGKFAIVAVKSFRSKRLNSVKVGLGQLFKAFIIRSKINSLNKSGISRIFNKSFAVLLTKQNNFVGTRVFGVLPKQVKLFRKIKLGAMALGFT